MDAKKGEPKKLSMASTKQEMMDAYNAVLKQLREKEESELKPEKKAEEKKVAEVIKTAEAVSAEGIATHIAGLKTEIGKMLSQVADKLEVEAQKLDKVQQAVEIREKELRELYGIEKEAQALAALIEAQNRKRNEFETKMSADQEELTKQIESTRAKWDLEKKAREAEIKEWEAAEKKKREREKEEFEYGFKREQRLARDAFEDEKAHLEKEIETRRREMENALDAREKAVSEREQQMGELEKRVAAFPKELEAAVKKATQETTDRISADAGSREQLLKKEFDGEKKVLTTKIEALEKTVKEQHEQITKLTQQLEKSYQKVEDIAVKAVQSASAYQSAANLHQMITEQARKQSQEK